MSHWLSSTLLLLCLTTGCDGHASDVRHAAGQVGKTTAALVVVDDTRGSPGALAEFGQDGVPTFGQVVTAPADNPLLTQFGVLMLSVPGSVVFRGEVFAWDGEKATGASLYESPPTSTSDSSSQVVTFNTGAVALTPGSEYVLFVSTSKDAGSGAGNIAGQPATSYPGGASFFEESGTDPGQWTTGNWSPSDADADLAFTATFEAFPSTTTLASSRAPSIYGQSVTFTAAVTGAQGTPDGTVTFAEGAQSLGSMALDGSGKATFSTALLGAGTHSITAAYPGSTVYEPSTSAVLSQIVEQASSTTVVTSSAAPSVVGDSVMFTATVARLGAGAGVPSGTVTFKDGAATLGTGAADGAGVAAFTASALGLGSHSITAVYGGDANFDASTSPAFTELVNQDGVTVTVVSSVNPSVYLGTVTFQATVAAVDSSSGSPGGAVTFKEGATTLGVGTLDATGAATFATAALPAGSHTVIATYGGDENHSSASASVTQIVAPAPSTTTLVSATNPAAFGQSVTLTATVSGEGVTPSGNVTFFDGTTALGSGTLGGAGQTSLTVSALAVGTRALTASYAGGGNYLASVSVGLQEQVNRATTATTLTSSNTPSIAGALVTFTAVVTTVAPGVGTATGSVTFRDGTTTLGTGRLSAAGVATFATRALTVNTHSITADYPGDTHFTASTSQALSQVVNQDGASVSLAPSANPSIFGADVTFTATVTSVGTGGLPTGSVTFKDGTTVLATGTLGASGTTTFTTRALAGGPHTISATYAGDVNHTGGILGTIIQSVDPAPTTLGLASSTSPSVFGQRITLTATATAGPTAPFAGTVTYLDGATVLGTSAIDDSGTATLSVSSLSIATHALRAVFGGDLSHGIATSAALTQVVGVVQTATALASASNPAVVGKTLTFTATVTAQTPGTGVPTGMVTFSDGKVVLGGETVDGSGMATLDTGTLAEGQHTITAAYAGDGTYGPSTSAVLSQKLATQVTTVVVDSAPNPADFGAPVVLTVTVDGSVVTPTGSVTFRDGTTALGDVSLDASGTASFSTTSLVVGTHTLSAAYAGDGANAAGSGTVSELVNAADTTTTLTSDDNPSFIGDRVTFTATVKSSVPGITGDVEFFDGQTSLGTVSLSGTTAVLGTAALRLGGHAITAAYAGDASFTPSTSSIFRQMVDAHFTEPGADAGAGHDGGALPPSSDAGTSMDGGAPPGNGNPPFVLHSGDAGCGCRMTRNPSGGAGVVALAGVAALFAGRRVPSIRRRRRRRRELSRPRR